MKHMYLLSICPCRSQYSESQKTKKPWKVNELQSGWSKRQRNVWKEGEMVFVKQYLTPVSGIQKKPKQQKPDWSSNRSNK